MNFEVDNLYFMLKNFGFRNTSRLKNIAQILNVRDFSSELRLKLSILREITIFKKNHYYLT